MTTISLLLVSSLTAAPQGVLLDFTATWCGPCRQMSSIVSRLQRQGYPIRKVDVDQEPNLARQYRIKGIPAFVLIVRGEEVNRITGMTSEGQLKRLLSQIPTGRPAKVLSGRSLPLVRAVPKKKFNASIDLVKNQRSPRRKKGFSIPFLGKISKARPVELEPQLPERPIIRAKHRDPLTRVARIDPLSASTRIRVKDRDGFNFGSGTVIDSRPGRTIVLTCGHLFRNLQEDAIIEVDVFNGKRSEKYLGKVLRYDLQVDAGLVVIPTVSAIAFAKVAAAGDRIAPGDPVFSIGCSGGEHPSKRPLRITALNRYRGPDNIECTGIPDQGRSGGGLFNAEGKLIGVCFAADPRDKRGLYADIKAIHKLLDQTSLTRLYRNADSRSNELNVDQRNVDVAQTKQPSSLQDDRTIWADTELTASSSGSTTSGSTAFGKADDSQFQRPARANSDSDEFESINAMIQRSGEAEVICIIRPLDNPQAASRVVIINRAS
jgi:thiol-disulfide isomerase/thioredoxin